MRVSNLKTGLIFLAVALVLAATIAWREFARSDRLDAHSSHESAAAHDERHDHDEGDDHGGHEDSDHAEEGKGHGENIVMTDAQMKDAGIALFTAMSGTIETMVSLPARIVAANDRVAKVVPRIDGIVTDVQKNIGDPVTRGDVMAVIESREMAEAVAGYLAAMRTKELARKNFTREETLWKKKITAEQDYLNAQNQFQLAEIETDRFQEKLLTIGVDARTITNLSSAKNAASFRFYRLTAPISGRVAERSLILGEYVDTAHTAFSVADLSVVWAKAAISPGDLEHVREGQRLSVVNGEKVTEGKLLLISPIIDDKTSSAVAIAEISNPDGIWKPGQLVNVSLTTARHLAALAVPKSAVQNIEGQDVVFVRADDAFRVQPVTIGRQDQTTIEIVSGLNSGDKIASGNSFVLKAELGKSEAEHEH